MPLFSNSTSIERYALAAIVLLAAGLRLALLDRESFWRDESLPAYLACQPLEKLVSGEVVEVGYPSAQLMAAHIWSRSVGSSDFALRLLPALTGVLGVIALYGCALQFVSSRCAVLAAGLAAINPLHVYLSQEFRTYSTMFLSTALALGAAAAYRTSGSIGALALWVASVVVGMNVHYYAALPAVGLFLFVAATVEPGLRRRWWAANMVVAVVGLVLVRRVLEDVAPHATHEAVGSGFRHVACSPLSLLFGRTLAWERDGVGLAVGALVVATAIWGAAFAAGLRTLPQRGLLIVAAGFPVAVALVLLLGAEVVAWDDRKALVVLAPLLVMLAHGVAAAPGRLRATLVGTITILSAVSLFRYYTEANRDDWRSIAALLAEQMEDEDAVLVAPDEEACSLRRYLPGCDPCRAYGDSIVGFDVDAERFVEYDAEENRLHDAPPALLQEASRVWVVYDARRISGDALQEKLARRGALLERLEPDERFDRANVLAPYVLSASP
ncbi:MAG: glycosyltransferase family 39 protein [Pirellulales bacterium]|nr:glycosyltransferase family 39 protein [Pirellulales bacterium]